MPDTDTSCDAIKWVIIAIAAIVVVYLIVMWATSGSRNTTDTLAMVGSDANGNAVHPASIGAAVTSAKPAPVAGKTTAAPLSAAAAQVAPNAVIVPHHVDADNMSHDEKQDHAEQTAITPEDIHNIMLNKVGHPDEDDVPKYNAYSAMETPPDPRWIYVPSRQAYVLQPQYLDFTDSYHRWLYYYFPEMYSQYYTRSWPFRFPYTFAGHGGVHKVHGYYHDHAFPGDHHSHRLGGRRRFYGRGNGNDFGEFGDFDDEQLDHLLPRREGGGTYLNPQRRRYVHAMTRPVNLPTDHTSSTTASPTMSPAMSPRAPVINPVTRTASQSPSITHPAMAATHAAMSAGTHPAMTAPTHSAMAMSPAMMPM
jgi:hypothetical protein